MESAAYNIEPRSVRGDMTVTGRKWECNTVRAVSEGVVEAQSVRYREYFAEL